MCSSNVPCSQEEDLSSPLTPPTLEDLEQYSEWTSSRLYYLSLNLLGVDNRTIDELFSHLGKASGLALLLSSVPFHAGFGPAAAAARQSPSPGKQQYQQQRRLMLPHEYLLQHKVIEEDVYRNGGGARGFKDAVYDTATRANDYIITARTMIRDELGGKVPEAVVGPLVGAVSDNWENHHFVTLTAFFSARRCLHDITSNSSRSTILIHSIQHCRAQRQEETLASAGPCGGQAENGPSKDAGEKICVANEKIEMHLFENLLVDFRLSPSSRLLRRCPSHLRSIPSPSLWPSPSRLFLCFSFLC